MDGMLDIMTLSAKLEQALLGEREESRALIGDMPWITLPPDFSFKVTFPFCGAAARFRVCKTDEPDNDVSVYFDTKDVLGCFGAPYWEAYPIGDDGARFAMDDTSGLVEAIVEQLSKPK